MTGQSDEVKLFLHGKYSDCLTLIAQHQLEKRLYLSQQLCLHNNAAVCIYLQNDSIPGNRDLCKKELKECIVKCRSVPKNGCVLAVELTALYNYMYLCVCIHGNREVKEQYDDKEVYQVVVPTLKKVYRLLCSTDQSFSQCGLPLDYKAHCDLLMEKCWRVISLQTATGTHNQVLQEIIGPLTLCTCILSVLAIVTEDCTTATEYLTYIITGLQHTDVSLVTRGYRSGYTLPLGVLQDNWEYTLQTDYLSNLTYSLFAVNSFLTSNWTGCRDNIKHVSSPYWSSLRRLLLGLSYQREGQYVEAVTEFSPDRTDTAASIQGPATLPVRLQARLYTLVGDCLANLNKPHVAIQMYKEALSADFGFQLPLYKISQQYQKLGVTDIELECLSHLVKALSSSNGTQHSHRGCVLDVLKLVSVGDQNITYPQAVYLLAKRSLDLKKFKLAVVHYVDLLAYLTDSTGHFQTDEVSRLSVPPILTIYHEAVEAMLGAREYQSCLALCDKVLVSYPTQSPDTTLDLSTVLNTSLDISLDVTIHSQRKRLRSSGSEVIPLGSGVSSERSLDSEVLMLKCKAEALGHIGDSAAAMDCLHSAILKISEHRKKLFTSVTRDSFSLNTSCVDDSNTEEPHTKRRRLGSDGESTIGSGAGVSVTRTPPRYSSVANIEADLYRRLGCMLSVQQQFSDSLHYFRLAVQLVPDNMETMYHTSQTLLEIQRPLDAAQTWLRTRLSSNLKQLNLHQLQSLLNTKQQALMCLNPDRQQKSLTSITELQQVQMDVTCLEYLIKSHENK